MGTKYWVAGIVSVVGAIGSASACPPVVVPQACCQLDAAGVVVSESVVVQSALPLAVVPTVVVESPLVARSVVVAPHVAAVAVRPTIVRQRVVVRNFGLLRPRVRW